MSTAVLFHSDCPDGWTSAWVAHRALDDPTLFPVRHGSPPPDLTGYGEVYIVDFSYPHDTLTRIADGRRLVVLDHHQSAIDDICANHGDYPGEAPWGDGSRGDEYVMRYDHAYRTVLDTNRSGAGITWDWFHPGEPRPPVVDYVEDRDLWRFNLDHSREVSAYIRSQPYTLDRWDTLAGEPVDAMAATGLGVLLHVDAYCRAAANHYLPTESDIDHCAVFSEVYVHIHRERIRAHAKHKDKPGGSMEMKDFDEPDWLPVLVEEVGEVAKVLCDHRHGLLTDSQRTIDLRDELVQVAAMAAAWIDAIDQTPCRVGATPAEDDQP